MIQTSGPATRKGIPVTEPNQDLLGTLAEQYLDYLSGAREQPPNLTGLAPEAQRDARASWRLLRAAWRNADDYTPPPLHDDPLAVALGLIPDPTQALDGRKLAQARRARGLKTSQLAELLADRGWDTPQKTVVRWEMAGSVEIAPALLTALADELRVPADRLVTSVPTHNPAAQEIETATALPRFADLAARWAAKAGLSLEGSRNALRQTMLVTTARRGKHLTADEWLAVLEGLIEAGSSEGGQA